LIKNNKNDLSKIIKNHQNYNRKTTTNAKNIQHLRLN